MNDLQQEMEREFYELARRVFNAPQQINFKIDTFHLLELIGFIQFAWRGAVDDARIQDRIKRAGESLAHILIAVEPELLPHVERGWRSEYDVWQDTRQWADPNKAVAAELMREFEEPDDDDPGRCPACGALLYADEQERLRCTQCDWDDSEWYDYPVLHLDDDDPNTEPDLGECCICQTTHQVRNILMLPHPGPMPGRGWGCFQCGLPQDGAAAVLCDPCLKRHQAGEPLRFICTGYPANDGRTPIDEMSRESFVHDLSQHPEEQADPADKPYYECHLIAFFEGVEMGIHPIYPIAKLDPARADHANLLKTIHAGQWAEVNIPYHTPTAVYGYRVVIAFKPANQPAIHEILLLQQMAGQIHAMYHTFAKGKD